MTATSNTDLLIAVAYIAAGMRWVHRNFWRASDPLSLLNEDSWWA